MNKKHTVYLGFGGNIGNVEENINAAIKRLCEDEKITLTKQSSFWYTEPLQCDEEATWFTNAVASFETSYQALELLELIMHIEQHLGRERKEGNRNLSRTIDIDMLDYKNESMDTKRLILPHPRMFQRAFVLVPLLEINPDYLYDNRDIHSYLSEIKYKLVDKNIYQQ